MCITALFVIEKIEIKFKCLSQWNGEIIDVSSNGKLMQQKNVQTVATWDGLNKSHKHNVERRKTVIQQ